ncbi:TMEM62 [Cordylochernes scorpioides]|uniref:TMEM62 n=1 Tax=Cordylochernes scorpioides TaxID=51811 RepID=A0ABY6LEW9_9ARAC|nr:TMEM62 [Cordylochernes scorpioides]
MAAKLIEEQLQNGSRDLEKATSSLTTNLECTTTCDGYSNPTISGDGQPTSIYTWTIQRYDNRTLQKLNFISKRPRSPRPDYSPVTEASRYLIVTRDEKWIYLRNPDTRRQWVPVIKSKLIFKLNRIALAIKNADFYLEQLNRTILLQHDNASAHGARLTTNRIKYLKGIDVIPHPAYSLDITPSYHALFRSKTKLQSSYYIEAVQQKKLKRKCGQPSKEGMEGPLHKEVLIDRFQRKRRQTQSSWVVKGEQAGIAVGLKAAGVVVSLVTSRSAASRRRRRVTSGRVDDPARRCQESLTSERPTSRV